LYQALRLAGWRFSFPRMATDVLQIQIRPPVDRDPRTGGGNAYIICDEVDDYFRKIKATGAEPISEPGDRMYGMRDFVIHDPDGNQFSFGCDNEKA